MVYEPRMKQYAHSFKTIDSHTMGEATRIIYDGFPALPGNSMMEKKKYVEKNFDHYRTALMLEPRGHRDMFGALLTEPVHKQADVGVIFMDSGGYLNMCGHGSIGTATVAVETGMVKVQEPYTHVVLDAPSGLIRTKVHVVNQKAVEVSILNVPSFLYKRDQVIELQGYGKIVFDISFGGSFFALIDAQSIGLELCMDKIEKITDLGMKIKAKINKEIKVEHPYLDINTVDLVEFYAKTDSPHADMKNCVIFGASQADRSPCGTGTSAKIATLYAKGELKLGEEFVYESITGSIFKGKALEEVSMNGFKAIVPQITGSAYITGKNEWILSEDDPLEHGFLLGAPKAKKIPSVKNEIIQAAWKLFWEKGYEQTSVEDILLSSNKKIEDFNCNFQRKEDLLDTLGDLFDQKYADIMLEMQEETSNYEKLISLNQELFRLIETQVPFPLIRTLYASDEGLKHKNLWKEDRLYYHLIPDLIARAQKSGEFKQEETPQEMAETYSLLERGMIYNWCIKGGTYSLTLESKKLLPVYLKEFLV